MKRDQLLFPIDSNHESCTGWACTGHWDHQTFWWETECKEMKERADTEFEWNRNWPMPRLEHGLATLLWHWQSSGRSVEQLQAGQISNVCILRDCTHTSPIGGTITFLIRELIEKENNPVFNCPEQLNRWPCHWLSPSVSQSLTYSTFTFGHTKSDPRDLWPLRHFTLYQSDEETWPDQHFDIFEKNYNFWQFLTIFEEKNTSCWQVLHFWQFFTIFTIFTILECFWQFFLTI